MTRWWRRSTPTTCQRCGATSPRPARWCGDCGALLAAPQDAEEEPDGQDATADTDTGRGLLLRRGAVGVAVAVLLTGVVLQRPPVTGEPLVGRVDVTSGASSTGPPRRGLQPAWERTVEPLGPDRPIDAPIGVPIVRDGHVLVAGLVAEVATGRVVADIRAATHPLAFDSTTVATFEEGGLVTADVVTGAVRDRVPLDPGDSGVDPARVWSPADVRGPGTSLFRLRPVEDSTGHGQWVLVADDGSVVATGDGEPSRWFGERHPDAPYALVAVPSGAGVPPALEDVEVVDLTTGDVVWRGPGGSLSLRGDHLLAPAVDGAPGATTFVDLRTGAARRLPALGPGERPGVLLAVTPEGDPVVGHDAQPVRASLVRDGVAEVVATADGPNDVWYGPGPVVGRIASDGEVVVQLAGAAVLAEPVRPGVPPLWLHRTAVAPTQVAIGDGVVAVLVERGAGQVIDLLDATTGELLSTIEGIDRPWPGADAAPRPVVVLDDAIGFTQPGFTTLQPRLNALRWLDPVTGEPLDLPALVQRWTAAGVLPSQLGSDAEELERDGLPTPAEVRRLEVAGTVAAADGVVRPVLGGFSGQGPVRLLAPDGRLRTVELAEPVQERRLVAVDADTLVVEQYGSQLVERYGSQLVEQHGSQLVEQHGSASLVVVDRDSGAQRSLELVGGERLLGDLLLAQAAEGGGMRALSVPDGEVRWEGPALPPWLPARRAGEQVVVVGGLGTLLALDPADGQQRWQAAVGGLLAGAPVLSPRHVVVATLHGEVLAVDRADGQVAWRQQVGSPVASFAVAGDDVVVGTHDGQVLHLGADGSELQRLQLEGPSPTSASSAVTCSRSSASGSRACPPTPDPCVPPMPSSSPERAAAGGSPANATALSAEAPRRVRNTELHVRSN